MDYSEIFASEGPLAREIPGYQPREAQQTMARAVGRALEQLDALIVEAGTGTGKTFAYLVPALLSGRRVIISTGTRTLQDQLFQRDLPTVAQALGLPVRIALLKGRANYLCRYRLKLNEQARLSRERAMEYANIARWARTTSSGDISEVIDVPETSQVWPLATSTVENCIGQICPEYEQCHVVGARRKAQDAELIVVNHHLLMADFALKEDGFGRLLPDADAYIVDEAHQLPEIATQFFGLSLSTRQLLSILRDARSELLRMTALSEHDEWLDRLERGIADARLELPRQSARLEWSELPIGFGPALDAISEQLATLSERLAPLAAHDVAIEHLRRRALAWVEQLPEMHSDQQMDTVRWVDVSRRGFVLNHTPLEVATNMGEVYASREAAWVFTSATLAVREDFSHFATRIGLQDARTLKLESPFDFDHNALIYMPPNLPLPKEDGHTNAVLDVARPIIDASQGSVFLLFTSHRALRAAASLLEDELDYPVLVQGNAPRDELLRRFRELGNAVLLGTASFWEGVDVRGPALRVVVIDKLPFAAPGDPVFQARLESIRARGGNPFAEFQLPAAVIALKQGVGRLIRDVDDYGVAVLCDPRLNTHSYGRVFLRSLPPMPLTDDLDHVRAFLRTQDEQRQALPA